MFPVGLFITTLFTISNFVYVENGNFEKTARLNYLEYLKTTDEVQYDSNFIDNLYNYGYYDNDTSITVLTPGMFGNKDYWFPKTYDQTSESYVSNYLDVNSLVFKIINTQNFIMNDIPILSFKPNITENNVFDSVDIEQLTFDEHNGLRFDKFHINYRDANYLLNKHIVLIYDGAGGIETNNAENDLVASYFSKSLDSVLAKFVVFHQGNLPRINLIGHSRGGILNLYYAYKRKNIVDNFITIGTPYTGSLVANLATSFYELGEVFNITIEDLYGYASLMCDDFMLYGHDELLSSINNSYKVAIGGEMTPVVFCNELLDLIDYISNNVDIDQRFGSNSVIYQILSTITNTLSNNDNLLMSTVVLVCNSIKSICNNALNLLNVAEWIGDLLTLFPNVDLNENFDNFCEKTSAFLINLYNICDNISNFDQTYTCVKTDFCVELDSQLGNSFLSSNFDQKITIPFGTTGYNYFLDNYLSNVAFPKVIHNYECNYPSIVNNIFSILVNRNSLQHITIPNGHYEMDINPYRVPFYNLTPYFINEFYSNDIYFYGNEFGFRDYYYYESEVSAHPGLLEGSIEIDDFEIETQRMRTGYIQNEKIVLSPNRDNAGLAFIEFYFSEPIHALIFDISLWSSNELFEESEQRFAYTLYTDMRDFIFGTSDLYFYHYHNALYGTMTARGKAALMSSDPVFNDTFNFRRRPLADFSTDRNSPDKMYVLSSVGFTFIGFYTASNVTSVDRNKGRICLSNFEIYK